MVHTNLATKASHTHKGTSHLKERGYSTKRVSIFLHNPDHDLRATRSETMCKPVSATIVLNYGKTIVVNALKKLTIFRLRNVKHKEVVANRRSVRHGDLIFLLVDRHKMRNILC